MKKPRVALVYDRVNKWGGAERVLLALQKIFPKAPLFTAVVNFKKAPWVKGFRVIPSSLQKWPGAADHHEFYPWLTPLMFESFDFVDFDLVISVTSAEAKGIITQPQTLHLCYCLTPTRYLWSGSDFYQDSPGFGRLDFLAKPVWRGLVGYLRRWDQVAAQRPDVYLAISGNVQKRIKNYYQRDAKVIYPPVDLGEFKVRKPKAKGEKEEFFLVVSRLVAYKRVDLVVKAFNQLGWPLKIVGVGHEQPRLERLARANIEFLGQLTDEKLLGYYNSCQAVVYPQEEDFGLVPLEAQACGKPVIAFRGGGALETVVAGKTGDFFASQTTEALKKVLNRFRAEKYSPVACQQNAARFSQEKFINKFSQEVESLWQNFPKKR